MVSNIVVSVFCLAYNHEKYIRGALEGFVSQKTNFAFEVLVHDDASTDHTAEIIREYAEKYPHIIKPILQTENQYSKGVRILRELLLPQAKGKYFAWCEGDDCWIDDRKLQMQVDFLEAHPDYSACYHRIRVNDIRTGSVRYIPKMEHSRDFDANEIVQGGAIFQLSAAMMRSELYRQLPVAIFAAKGFGDIQLYIYSAMCGKCYVFFDVMSQYNHGTAGSWTIRTANAGKDKRIEHEQCYKAMLERVNQYYNYQYDEAFSYAIKRLEFNIHVLQSDRTAMRRPEYHDFYVRYKKQQKHLFFKKYFPWLAQLKKLLKKR